MNDIRARLGKTRLFCDGGSGTFLQARGLTGGEAPERWNLTHPQDVIDLHCAFLTAGSDIFNTNTFGANRLKYPEDLREVVEAAVALAREARIRAGREDAYIALDIGPTGKLLQPLGDLPFEEAVDIFGEVVRIGAAQWRRSRRAFLWSVLLVGEAEEGAKRPGGHGCEPSRESGR